MCGEWRAPPKSEGGACGIYARRFKRAYDSDKVFRLNQNIGPD